MTDLAQNMSERLQKEETKQRREVCGIKEKERKW